MRLLPTCAAALLIVSLAPAAAQPAPPPEVLEHAATDGVALHLDAPATLEAIRSLQDSITGQAVYDCVERITTDFPRQYRLMATPTQEAFLDAYEDVFADLGLASARHEFAAGGPGGVDTGGTNLVAVLPGTDPAAWVVVGGHYDTRELTVGGGALDNTSGICTVLELARAASEHAARHGPLNATLVFAWYDGEEWGLYGAQAFAADPTVARDLLGLAGEPERILVSQSFDMPGLNYPAKNTWVQYGDPAVVDEPAVLNLRTAPIHADVEWTCWSYGCYEELKQRDDFPAVLERNTHYQFLVREVAYDVLALPPEAVWVYDDHYGRSDHIPLIAQGAAGMRIQGSHDEEYPHYHQPTDTLPALEQLAGGRDLLVAGYETEAEAGGLTALYVAFTGGVGRYGDPFLGREPPAEPETEGRDSPGVPLVPLAMVLVGLGLFGRRGRWG